MDCLEWNVSFGQPINRSIPITYPLIAAPSIPYKPCGDYYNNRMY